MKFIFAQRASGEERAHIVKNMPSNTRINTRCGLQYTATQDQIAEYDHKPDVICRNCERSHNAQTQEP